MSCTLMRAQTLGWPGAELRCHFAHDIGRGERTSPPLLCRSV